MYQGFILFFYADATRVVASQWKSDISQPTFSDNPDSLTRTVSGFPS